jgi:hypothetical protein
MSSVQLARITLKEVDGQTPVAIAEWDKHAGYVIGVYVPVRGEENVVNMVDRSVHATVPEALRELAKLIESWE